MGKASKWFRGLLGLKKPDRNPIPSEKPASPKKKWSFSMSHKEKDLHKPQHGRVLAVAVKQTSRGGNSSATAYVSRSCAGYWTREEWAAVMIQSRFRAYLSRRALRALKALVKLQALVRGHLLRKRTADTLRQLQALVRAQTRARVTRLLLSDQSPHPHGPATPQKIEQHVIRMNHQHSIMLKRNGSKSNSLINYDREKSHLGRVWIDSKTSERLWEQGSFTRSTTTPTDDERSDKILHVDTQKPRFTPKRRNLFHSSSDQNCPSFSTSKDSGEIQSFSPLKYAQTSSLSSPRYYSAISSKREETFTPTKSDGSRSYLSGCSDNPNYMAYTESSKAKARSLSVPKQRQQQYEKSSSMKRYSVHHVYGGHESNFTSKAYPGSGRLDRLGMPISRGDVSRFSGGHWHRYY